MNRRPTSRFSRNSMVAVAEYSTRSDVGLTQLTLSAAGIPYVIATDPIELTNRDKGRATLRSTAAFLTLDVSQP